MPFSIVRDDIARVEADVLVNAANERLAPGGGVCGALFAGAGYDRMAEACARIGGCPTGRAVATPGFDLPCRWVVHAVGPVWRGGSHGERDALRSCYRSVFAEVERLGARSVAFPLISAGIYGYPPAEALAVAREETAAFLERAEDVQATLVVFSRDVIRAGAGLLDGLRAFIDDAYVEASPFRRRAPQEGAVLLSDSQMPPLPAPGIPAPDLLAPAPAASAEPPAPAAAASMASMSAPRDLADLLDHLDESFSTTLLALIDARGLTDAQVYKRANISRQLFSKIRSNPAYRPTKPTAVALGVALGLTLDELRDLLARAGFALSRSSRFDVIVEFYVARGVYDIFRINEALFAYDEQLLGSI